MSLLRKVSMKRKSEDGSPKGPGMRGDKPPQSRSVSGTSSMSTEGDGKVKRKASLLGQKSKKRLSALFSSSISSQASDRERTSSPSTPRSRLNTSTSSSGASTPTRGNHTSNMSSANGHGSPNGVTDGVANLRLGTNEVPLVSNSPESSPISPDTTRHSFSAVSAVSVEDGPRRKRTPSMYSQWDLEEAAEASSSDDEAFLTPSEGLSEVEEGDEDEDLPTKSKSGTDTGEVGSSPIDNPTFDATNVEKGATAQENDVCGTGPSTLRRTKATVDQTRVKRRPAGTKGSALSIDQGAVLAGDLDLTRAALTLFLTSKMKAAEDMCIDKDPQGNHMYLISAHGIINSLKGMMTFDSHDLADALEICKATSITASALRRPTESIVSRLGGLIKSGAAVQRVKAMTVLERHAELVYAETSLMKALLAIIAGGDWLGLIREALNMRTAHGIYRVLQMYMEESDKDGFDEDIDMDFRSGVLLGTGTSSLMLSLLPSKVLKFAEVFGYAGDRAIALDTLMSAGGWSKDSIKPSYDETNEGLRRPICDMILLAFHLVISVLMPVDGVDIPVARNILAYNMRRYPDGVFFLYFQARLHTNQCEPEMANECLQRALDLPLEYVQLQHMCLWDYALNHFMTCNMKGALDCFSILKNESNWSRAVYTYSTAACLVEMHSEGDAGASLEIANELMKDIPKLTKKIAGKSLPIEKLCNRKARKFESQGHTLFLPAMELAYVYGALTACPRRALLGLHLPRINKALDRLESVTPEQYGNGHQYWDDYCLGHFLRAVVQSIARYPPHDAAEEAKTPQPGEPTDEEIDRGAEKDFEAVLRHAPDVQLDHFILYHCHYEFGRLYASRGDKPKARFNFDVVMSGKLTEVNQFEKKASGKYSLEGALLLKTHAALQSLNKA